jgi:hypothetical protein
MQYGTTFLFRKKDKMNFNTSNDDEEMNEIELGIAFQTEQQKLDQIFDIFMRSFDRFFEMDKVNVSEEKLSQEVDAAYNCFMNVNSYWMSFRESQCQCPACREEMEVKEEIEKLIEGVEE